MGNWSDESDANIDSVIKEFSIFESLGKIGGKDKGKVNSSHTAVTNAVNDEFKDLIDRAKEVRLAQVGMDGLKVAADVAALSSIESFGFGFLAFTVLEAMAVEVGSKISAKSSKLTDKLGSIPHDIGEKIDPHFNLYITAFKHNNQSILGKRHMAKEELELEECRRFLYQFMSHVSAMNKPLTVKTFKKYAREAKVALEANINTVCQDIETALQTLHENEYGPEEVKKFLKFLESPTLPHIVLDLVQVAAMTIMIKRSGIEWDLSSISRMRSAIAVEMQPLLGVEPLLVEGAPQAVEQAVEVSTRLPGALGAADCVAKFSRVLVVVASIVDGFMAFMDAVDAYNQTEKLIDMLNEVKPKYLEIFNSLIKASQLLHEKAHAPRLLQMRLNSMDKELQSYHLAYTIQKGVDSSVEADSPSLPEVLARIVRALQPHPTHTHAFFSPTPQGQQLSHCTLSRAAAASGRSGTILQR